MRSHLVSALVVSLLLAVACEEQASETSTGGGMTAATVSTARVDRGSLRERLVTYGTVEFDPSATHDLPFLRAGEVKQVEVVRGQEVDRGDRLIVLGAMPHRSLAARQAAIDLEAARRQLERVRRLALAKLATNGELNRARHEAATREAALRALGLGGAGEQVLLAPTRGVVAQVLAKPGMLVDTGQTALRIVTDGRMVVRTGFELEELPALAAGLSVEILPIYGDGSQEIVRTKLSGLHRIADPRNQLVEALLSIPQETGWLVPGERVEIHVILKEVSSALRVPRRALAERKGQTGVFAVQTGTARWIAVEVLGRDERWVAVRGELSEGMSVVTKGRTTLVDGMTVRSMETESHR